MPAAAAPGLQVEELSHRFGDRLVVDRVALAIEPGEVHCLVGPSGCGKTTSLRLIAGLENLQAGRISLNGRLLAEPGRSMPPERRRVGLMFQDFALFPHLRVGENVAFGLNGRDRRGRDRRVAELLAAVNMSPYARAYPHTLSGGEQQRVALARALAPAPELMLLDEAFSALDTSLRAQVREETLTLLREAGTPTLLVTHDAEEAIRVGDRIHAMLAGRIVQSGTPSELYAAPVNGFVAGFFGPVNRFRGRVEPGRGRDALGSGERHGPVRRRRRSRRSCARRRSRCAVPAKAARGHRSWSSATSGRCMSCACGWPTAAASRSVRRARPMPWSATRSRSTSTRAIFSSTRRRTDGARVALPGYFATSLAAGDGRGRRGPAGSGR